MLYAMIVGLSWTFLNSVVNLGLIWRNDKIYDGIAKGFLLNLAYMGKLCSDLVFYLQTYEWFSMINIIRI